MPLNSKYNKKINDESFKNEINRLNEKVATEGYTLVPLELYFRNNKAKILLGLAKGKHNYDKRAAIKEKELNREAKKVNYIL